MKFLKVTLFTFEHLKIVYSFNIHPQTKKVIFNIISNCFKILAGTEDQLYLAEFIRKTQ